MSNKLYDVLKWVALVAFDALGLFYDKMSAVWGLPFGDQIFETCVALSVLLGTLIGVSSTQYNKKKAE